MLQAMIFDMDGVLVNSHPAHYRAWQRFLQYIGKSEENLHIIYEGRKREEILRSFVGHDIEPQELRDLGRLKDDLFQEESSLVEPIPGITELLETLSSEGVKCAVATSAARPRCTDMLANLNLLRHFEIIIAGCDVTSGKPDPTIYRKAVEGLGISAANTLAVEDAVSGIIAARGAQLRCIGIESNGNGVELKKAGAHSVYSDFLPVDILTLRTILADPVSITATSQPRIPAPGAY
jgi:HAD superfamily hydrolase (TIGR01509 family)